MMWNKKKRYKDMTPEEQRRHDREKIERDTHQAMILSIVALVIAILRIAITVYLQIR